jgi:hypothetical protein
MMIGLKNEKWLASPGFTSEMHPQNGKSRCTTMVHQHCALPGCAAIKSE